MQKLHEELHPVEIMVLIGLLLAEALLTVLRLLLVPAVAALLALAGWRPGHRAAAAEEPVLTPTAPTPPAAAPEVTAAAAEPVAMPSLADLADDLLQLPAAQLRAMAGTRRRLPKRELTALILAMPV